MKAMSLQSRTMNSLIAVLCFMTASFNGAAAQATKKAESVTSEQVMDEWVTHIEQLVVPAAAAMPESKYSFAPTRGKFSGVRTFAEQVKHLAAANYQLGSRILGEDPPAGTEQETAPDSVKSKAQILEYLTGSFACLHRAAATVNENNLVEPIAGTRGTWQRTRLGLLTDALNHASDHYGQMVEYLRMNGIVPPASR
jgi:uncharacterized damage-inducible protein DinB